MGFLLGLFIGCSIFILGFVPGTLVGLSMGGNQNNDDDDGDDGDDRYSGDGRLKLIMPDFGDFVDSAVDCYEKNAPMMIRANGLDIILMDNEMHLNECFNIDNEG